MGNKTYIQYAGWVELLVESLLKFGLLERTKQGLACSL